MSNGAIPVPADLAPSSVQERADGWLNLVTALGVKGRDKIMSGDFQYESLPREKAEELWRGDAIAGRVVDTVPNEMTRMGFCVSVKQEGTEAPVMLTEQEKGTGTSDRRDALERRRRERHDAQIAWKRRPTPRLHGWRPPVRGKGTPGSRVDAADFMLDKDVSEQIDTWAEQINLLDSLNLALKYKNAYGGAAVILGVDDGQKMDQPINLEKVKTLEWLNVLTERELIPEKYYGNPFAANYGKVAVWRVQPETSFTNTIEPVEQTSFTLIHESRLLILRGKRTSNQEFVRSGSSQGWGESVLTPVWPILREYNQAWMAAVHLTQEISQGVLELDGLTELLAANKEDLVRRRAELIDYCRSVARMYVIDKNREAYRREAVALGGLAELLQQLSLRLSSAADQPVTLLMGQAPSGLNSTSDGEIRQFYDRCAGQRTRELLPLLKRVFLLMFCASEGPTKGQIPECWTVTFPPLWQMTQSEEADLEKKHAETDHIRIEDGVLLPEEVTMSRYGGDKYGHEISLDWELRAAYKAAEEERQAEQANTQPGEPGEDVPPGEDDVPDQEPEDPEEEPTKPGGE